MRSNTVGKVGLAAVRTLLLAQILNCVLTLKSIVVPDTESGSTASCMLANELGSAGHMPSFGMNCFAKQRDCDFVGELEALLCCQIVLLVLSLDR